MSIVSQGPPVPAGGLFSSRDGAGVGTTGAGGTVQAGQIGPTAGTCFSGRARPAETSGQIAPPTSFEDERTPRGRRGFSPTQDGQGGWLAMERSADRLAAQRRRPQEDRS